jgi:hypothetical protein
MRRNRRVFLSRTPSIRRVLMLKDVVADGLLGKATARLINRCISKKRAFQL